jgi:hypothetical protein
MKRFVFIVALALVAAADARATQRQLPPPGISWRPAGFAVQGTRPIAVASLGTPTGVAYVAWIDHTRTRLALYPGRLEPPAAPLRGPAQVPSGQRWRLLATFNGGFKARAGAGGMVVNGVVEEPMQNGMGTLVVYRDGTTAILDWLGRTNPRQLALARQNLAPLVWNGRPSARVLDWSAWGATLSGGSAVWRTAVGVTKQGDLVYAAGGGQTPASLANILGRVGAWRAIELDINPQWPSFIAYGHRGGRDPAPLVPNPQQSAYRYLSPDPRDFFAVYARPGGGSSVPFR